MDWVFDFQLVRPAIMAKALKRKILWHILLPIIQVLRMSHFLLALRVRLKKPREHTKSPWHVAPLETVFRSMNF
jgi:hypothetical protein